MVRVRVRPEHRTQRAVAGSPQPRHVGQQVLEAIDSLQRQPYVDDQPNAVVFDLNATPADLSGAADDPCAQFRHGSSQIEWPHRIGRSGRRSSDVSRQVLGGAQRQPILKPSTALRQTEIKRR